MGLQLPVEKRVTLDLSFCARDRSDADSDDRDGVCWSGVGGVVSGVWAGGDLRRPRPIDGLAVASSPEFLREGQAIADCLRPDGVVIGTDSERARAVLRQLYRPLYLIETPMLFTDIATAEVIKYAANAFLATK